MINDGGKNKLFFGNITGETLVIDLFKKAKAANAAISNLTYYDKDGIPLASFIILLGDETSRRLAALEASDSAVQTIDGQMRDTWDSGMINIADNSENQQTELDIG